VAEGMCLASEKERPHLAEASLWSALQTCAVVALANLAHLRINWVSCARAPGSQRARVRTAAGEQAPGRLTTLDTGVWNAGGVLTRRQGAAWLLLHRGSEAARPGRPIPSQCRPTPRAAC